MKKIAVIILGALMLLLLSACGMSKEQTVYISEIMSQNTRTYADENGDLCSYDVDREGFGNYVYFTFKEGTPLSVKQHFFTEAEKDDCDLSFIDAYAAPIGDKVLEALGYGSCKGGVSNEN